MTGPGGPKTASVVIIGNEILSGRTEDKNLAFLATRLGELGISVREIRVVADEEIAIGAAINACRAAYDYVFTTGGIGPTHDDITAQSVAKAFGVDLLLDSRALARLQHYYGAGELNDARRRMAFVPEGATLIDNPISHAPGFQLGNVFVLAGVPAIMRAMFEGLRDRLVGGPPILTRAISAYLPEGLIATPLARLQQAYGDVEIGSYPYPFFRAQRLGSRIVLRGTDAPRLDAASEDLRRLIRELDAEPVEDDAA